RAGTTGLTLAAQDPSGGQFNQGGSGEGRIPLFGKITAVSNSSIEIVNVNGDTVSIKVSAKTEFRKDRQPAKRSDFKVGDLIAVRGEENADHSWSAQVVAARSMNGGGSGGRGGPGGGAGGPGGRGRGEFGQQSGTLGKDFVAGEIKSVDTPRLSVLRTDNVTQTLELNEDTSLRKDREAVTMADIQPGDHLFARGAMQNDVFVPKTVMIVPEAQWKRMQEWSQGAGGGQRRRGPGAAGAAAGAGQSDAGSVPSEPGAPGTPPPSSPSSAPDTQKPPEPQN
ncbi:MAG TPA: DUF5666 domain-containing protein, partial [Acidobacteriaceae bacterium]